MRKGNFRLNRSIFAWQNFAALGKIRSRKNAMRTSVTQNSVATVFAN
jgi:hypothetical protein